MSFLAPFRRRHSAAEIDEEIRFHIETTTGQYIRQGMDPRAARRRALREFGGIEQVKEAVHDAHGGRMLEAVLRDGQFASRRLLRQPLFATLSILTLSLGIAAATAAWNVVDATLGNPLPYPDVHRLVFIRETLPAEGISSNPVAPGTFREWERTSTTFTQVAAYAVGRNTVNVAGTRLRVPTAEVTGDFFAVLGERPRMGRTFARSDERAAVVSERFAHALGGTIAVDGVSMPVIGVVGEHFRTPPSFDERGVRADIDVFTLYTPTDGRSSHWLTAIGRLREGTTAELAEVELSRSARSGWGVSVRPMVREYVAPARKILAVIAGSGILLMLIACLNVSGLALADIRHRRSEVAMRRLLGATPASIARQLITESMLLSGLACAVALFVSSVAARWIAVASGAPIAHLPMGIRHVAFSAAVTLVAGVLCAAAPIAAARGSALVDRRVIGHPRPARARPILLVAQVAAAFVVAVLAVLLLESYRRLRQVPPGFELRDVVTFSLAADAGLDAATAHRTYEQLVQRVRDLDGVRAASVVGQFPLTGAQFDNVFTIAGRRSFANVRSTIGDYFGAAGIRILRGRRANRASEVVVNETFARRFASLGGRVRLELGGETAERTIVGVAADLRHDALDQPAEPEMYVPFLAIRQRNRTLVVRTNIRPAKIASVVGSFPDLAIDRVSTTAALRGAALADHRRNALVTAAAAVAALLMAISGVYALVNGAIVSRRREIALRRVMGATPRRVVAMFAAEAISFVLMGMAVGVPPALLAASAVRALLFSVAPHDPLALTATAAFTILVAAVAATIPARRSAALAPAQVLRDE